MLTVTNESTTDWAAVLFGAEPTNRYDTTLTSAGLSFEAESLTPLGGAALAAGPAGATGAGSNVVRHTDLPSAAAIPILSTQFASGGSHLTHIGRFGVYVRCQLPTTNTGTVSLSLQWGPSDFRTPATNTTVNLPATLGGKWLLVNLGLVNVPTDVEFWEGRVLASSTVAGDDIDLDRLELLPTTYFGVARMGSASGSVAYTGRDEFNQTAGSLSGKTAAVGGNWSGAGDADDFTVNATNHNLERTAVSDASNTGRYAILGTTNYTTVEARVSMNVDSTSGPRRGLLLRYTDTNNWLQVLIDNGNFVTVRKRVAGTITTLAEQFIPNYRSALLFATVQANGAWSVQTLTTFEDVVAGYDADLATGGTLASGKVGIYDEMTTATALTRTYDNFLAWVPVTDAAAYGGRQIRFTGSNVERQDSGGTTWQPVQFRGNYLRIPVESARIIVRPVTALTADDNVMIDTGIGSLSGEVLTAPRYLSLA